MRELEAHMRQIASLTAWASLLDRIKEIDKLHIPGKFVRQPLPQGLGAIAFRGVMPRRDEAYAAFIRQMLILLRHFASNEHIHAQSDGLFKKPLCATGTPGHAL